MYDAIVVGARCAGAATAMLLARKGHRVLLVDRARFPSDTLSAHALRTPAVDRLRRWGVLDPVVATGAPAVRDVRFDVGPFALRGRALLLGATDAMYAPRRYLIDTILVDAAVRAGAELREASPCTISCTTATASPGSAAARQTAPPSPSARRS
jgi:2-polyprenyl-6-methoxyphenol hydroxylase-like FAD-dependent oxidoreductase